MAYSKEMQLLILQHPELIEQMTLTGEVEAIVFKAIDGRIAARLNALPDWTASYEWGADAAATAEETIFAPVAWPKRKDGSFQAGYRLREVPAEGGPQWLLSHALGLDNGTLSLEFFIDGKVGRPSKAKIAERLRAFLTATPALAEAGFIHGERGVYIPFKLDVGKVAAEFPTLNKALAPLDKALDTLLTAHASFEALVHELLPPKPIAAPKE